MANQTYNADREIDLKDVSKKLRGAVSKTNDRLFDVLLFFKRNLKIVLPLFVIGVALGIYLDSSKSYRHSLYVIPNFGSVDYLYAKINHLNAKLGEDDDEFFDRLGFRRKLGKVTIEPVVEIYQFIEGEDNKNFEMLKLMTENNDVSKVVEDGVTSRNYKRHVISFNTKGEANRKDAIEPMLKYLNDSKYFKVLQQETVEHLKQVIATNDSTLKQIDAILNDFSRSKAGTANGNLMYYNDNTNLNELIRLKNKIVKEQGENKIDLINSEQIIQDSEVVMNDKNNKGLAGKYKLVLPLLLIGIFIIINRFRAYYRKQMSKRQAAAV